MKKLPWLMLQKKTDPDFPLRAPLALGPLSNGEFFHPDTPDKQLIRKLIMEKAEAESKRHGVDRRTFLASAMGMCTSLYMINVVNGCGGGGSDPNLGGGGRANGDAGGDGPFNIPRDAMSNEDLAGCVVSQINNEDGKDDFIVDMQTHFINPNSAYLTNPTIGAAFMAFLSDVKNRIPWVPGNLLAGCQGFNCYDSDTFLEQFFLDSDTTIAVLSGIAYVQCAGQTSGCDFAPLTNQEINEAKLRINGSIPGRLLSHAMV